MSGADTKKKLVGRHKRVAFMDVAGDGKTYTRMTGFTSMSESKNASEYSRHYVDEESERTDVVGYAPSNDYELTVIPMIWYNRKSQRSQMMSFSALMRR